MTEVGAPELPEPEYQLSGVEGVASTTTTIQTGGNTNPLMEGGGARWLCRLTPTPSGPLWGPSAPSWFLVTQLRCIWGITKVPDSSLIHIYAKLLLLKIKPHRWKKVYF